MNSWSVLFIALAAVVLQAWVSRRGAPGWYMGCIIPLLYGAAVAWMFVGQDFLRALWVILLGSALPITLLISLGERTSPPQDPPASPPDSGAQGQRASQNEPAAGSNRSRGWLCHRSGPSHNFLLCLPRLRIPSLFKAFPSHIKKPSLDCRTL